MVADPPSTRAAHLNRIAALIEERRELFAVWESIDQGRLLHGHGWRLIALSLTSGTSFAKTPEIKANDAGILRRTSSNKGPLRAGQTIMC